MKNYLMLALLSFAIECPAEKIIVGPFPEQEHEQVEQVYTKNADHIQQMIDFVHQNLFPNMPLRRNFLDIGAGPGQITHALAPYFESTTVVEPNPLYAPIYDKEQYIVHWANFQDAEILTYDFILSAHMLYYVDRSEWASFLKKIYNALEEKGTALIVLMAPRGHWHDLCTSVREEYSNSTFVFRDLNSLGISYAATPNRSSCVVSDEAAFRNMVSLYVLFDCFTTQELEQLSPERRQEIDDLIEAFIKSCKLPDGTYEVFFDEDYIVVKK